MTTKNFKQGDTLPVITDQLLNATGSAVNLTGASGVYFLARVNGADQPRISGSATVVTAASGQVAYSFTANDLAYPGTYDYEWEVHDSSGIFTVPTAGMGTMTIHDDVGSGTITSTHASGTVVVNASSLDSTGAALGNAPPGGRFYALLGEQPVAVSVVDSSGHYSVTLVDDLSYTVQVYYPGAVFATKVVNT